MKTSSSTQDPGDAQLGEGEPTPLPPPPPPPDLDDDHYFDDDDEPSWWSTLRPLSVVHPGIPRPRDLEVLLPSPPVRLPPLPVPVRRGARDEVSATVHVLRVRSRLTADEQRAFDELIRGPAATDIVTMLVNRGEDDALDKLRRRLDDEPTAAETARRSVVAHVIEVSALLSTDDKARALAALAALWPEELVALHARLEALPPPEAAALIRTYLASRR
jgi:hypothetical protein